MISFSIYERGKTMPSPNWGIRYETGHFNLPLTAFPSLTRESGKRFDGTLPLNLAAWLRSGVDQ
jgi:hypothetical protein